MMPLLKNRVLGAAFGLATATHAFAKAEPSGREPLPSGFKLGASLEHHESWGGSTFELHSPGYVTNAALGTQIGLLLSASWLFNRNLYLNEQQKFETVSSQIYSLGLHFIYPIRSALFNIYTQSGFAYVRTDEKISKNKGSAGGRSAFGIEFPVRHEKDYDVIFVQHSIYYDFAAADKVFGQPDVFNGSSLSLGGRVYF